MSRQTPSTSVRRGSSDASFAPTCVDQNNDVSAQVGALSAQVRLLAQESENNQQMRHQENMAAHAATHDRLEDMRNAAKKVHRVSEFEKVWPEPKFFKPAEIIMLLGGIKRCQELGFSKNNGSPSAVASAIAHFMKNSSDAFLRQDGAFIMHCKNTAGEDPNPRPTQRQRREPPAPPTSPSAPPAPAPAATATSGGMYSSDSDSSDGNAGEDEAKSSDSEDEEPEDETKSSDTGQPVRRSSRLAAQPEVPYAESDDDTNGHEVTDLVGTSEITEQMIQDHQNGDTGGFDVSEDDVPDHPTAGRIGVIGRAFSSMDAQGFESEDYNALMCCFDMTSSAQGILKHGNRATNQQIIDGLGALRTFIDEHAQKFTEVDLPDVTDKINALVNHLQAVEGAAAALAGAQAQLATYLADC